MSYSHKTICKYLNWTAYTLRITGWFFSQLCRKRWWGHLHVNLQTEPVIHQHFLNKELFPNRPSSPNILMQCCVERSAWTLSTARISSSQSLCCINPPPAHVLPYSGHLSHEQPQSTLLNHGKCPGSVRDFAKNTPKCGRRWEVGERNRGCWQ